MTRTRMTTSHRMTITTRRTTTTPRSTPRIRSRRTSRRASTSTRRRKRSLKRFLIPQDASLPVGVVEAEPEEEARSPAHGAVVEVELRLVNKDKCAKFKDRDHEEDPQMLEEIITSRHKVGVVRHVLKDRAAIASDAVNLRILIANAESLRCIIASVALCAQL